MNRGAERFTDPGERQYHIGLTSSEVAPFVILVGDPARANVARDSFFEQVQVSRAHREFVTHTGVARGLPVTVMATGMGPDNTEIALIELLNCRRDLTVLRVGTCGGLQEATAIGDLVVSTGAVRLENTTAGFVREGYPAIAHHEVVLALVSALEGLSYAYHVGLTATAPGFYGWQGRRGQPIAPRNPELWRELAAQRVLNLEMEASALFTLGSLASIRTGAVCAVFANRPADEFIDPLEKPAAERRALEAGFGALAWLARMDASSGGRPFHLRAPS